MRDGKIWGDSGITVILAPSGDQGQKLLEVARDWTSIGLLKNSVWVFPDKKTLDHKKGPPRVEASVLGSAKAGNVTQVEEELFSLLSQYEIKKLRMICVRQAAEEVEFDELQDKFAEKIADYVEKAVPPHTTSQNSSNEDFGLMKFNLVTAPTEYREERASEYMDPIYNAHFVASPEDRSAPTSSDAFLRESAETDQFAGFTMMHVAALGALWQGITQGSFELAGTQRLHQNEVFVSRVFASAILTDGLVLRASARVMEKAGDSELGTASLSQGLATEGTFPIPDEQAHEWIEFMIQTIFSAENGRLEYQRSEITPDPEKMKLSFGQQVIDFLKFALDRFVSIPKFIWWWLKRKTIELFTNLFQAEGQGSAEVGSVEDLLDPRDEILKQQYIAVFERKEAAERTLVSPVAKKSEISSPELWERIRKLIFGMLDGSNQHLFGIEKSENGSPVFYNLKTLFPDPNDSLEVENRVEGDTYSLKWDSYNEWVDAKQTLSNRIQELGLSQKQSLDRRVEIEKEISKQREEVEELSAKLEKLGVE
mgnify:CR=1 FL=1